MADNLPPTEEKYNNDSPQSSGITGISGSLHMPHTPEKNDANAAEFDTIEEWIAYFVNAQALSSIDKFTNAYLSQEISGELFYAVIEELLTNFRTKLKHYGIIALNKTPSPESFDHLVHIIESNHHEAVQERANQAFIRLYTHPNYVGVIIDTLNSPKDSVRLKAIQVAVNSAQINLRPNNNLASREPQSRQRTSSQENNIDKYRSIINYQSLKIKLESMAQQDHNSTIRSQAQQAVDIISELLQQLT